MRTDDWCPSRPSRRCSMLVLPSRTSRSSLGSVLRSSRAPGGALVAVQLNHTIVSARDKQESAAFFADVLGVGPPTPFGPFLVVTLDNGVSLDFLDDYGLDDSGRVHPQHYAFLVTDTDFDEILGRIRARGLPYWAE